MNALRKTLLFVVALLATMTIVSLQLGWNLRTPAYLESAAQRSGVVDQLVAILPEYASSRLPNPDETKAAFTQAVTTDSVSESLATLSESVTAAYAGKTEVVTFSLEPITEPLAAAGYEVPPGTVFANQTVQVGGLADLLQMAARSTSLLFLALLVTTALLFLVDVKRGPGRTARSVLMLTALLLAGLFVATRGLPVLLDALVGTSGLDATIRGPLIEFLTVISYDAGIFYLVVAGLLLISAFALFIISNVSARHKSPAHKQSRKRNKRESKKESVGKTDEPW